MNAKAAVLCLALALPGCASTEEFNQGLGQILGGMGATGTGAPALAEGEIVAGLKEALAQGTTRAINQLGRSDGFWADLRVRVPLPTEVARVEKGLRQFGQGALVDQFHLTLNRAAEQAVPHVAEIFGNAVRQMTFQDARAILSGQQDAATQFFRRTTSEAIRARVMPIVRTSTERVGVTQRYKQMVGSYGPFLQMAGMKTTDLDAWVTDRALDGLFLMVAEEEARIRRDPIARTTEILRRVFGSR